MGSDRSDIDVIRMALSWIVDESPGTLHYERGKEALDRVAASLAEKDAQIERLRKAVRSLREYAKHPVYCDSWKSNGAYACSCGLDAALGVTDE